MSDAQQSALRFLWRVSGVFDDIALEGGKESSISIARSIAVSSPLDAAEQQLVERTINKISERRSLDDREQYALEAIIISDKRPVIDVLATNAFTTDHPLWQDLLSGAPRANLERALPAVGRVELIGHPSLPYGGTGFIVGPGLLMTNRHVAEIFATGLGGAGLAFRPGQSTRVDMERRADGGSLPVEVSAVRMIHPYWDMALLAVDGLPETLEPLRMAVAPAAAVPRIAAIGYPAFDQRNDPDVQRRVFRNLYNVKRIMPGELTGSIDVESFGKTVHASKHDSSTLGGASGSAVIDLASGAVLALHFGGIYLETNYGVPACDLARDGRVIDAGVSFAGDPVRTSGVWDRWWSSAESARAVPSANAVELSASARRPAASRTATVTVPVRITVEIGDPADAVAAPIAALSPALPAGAGDVLATETPAEDYTNRGGYDANFLGTDAPLPVVKRAAADVLTFAKDGTTESELRYEHFSIVMSRSRRLCFFSAVNIDGATSHKSARSGWRLDGRIPPSQQILNECYGNPPKFSRGHMTRREDPVWGDAETCARGNADSMHVTNTVPQMQAFNSPIWLGLEDYALQRARADAMRISVFTGPYFADDDPVIAAVRIPVAFWKVIAFIHDDTRQLTATGYEMDQRAVLPKPSTEFVFGDFSSPQTAISAQVAVRAIEQRAGLSFNGLAARDPLAGATEAAFGTAAQLDNFEQIRFF